MFAQGAKIYLPLLAAIVSTNNFVLLGQDAQLVPAGEVLKLRLRTGLSSKDSISGASFTAVTVEPYRVEGVEVIPAGSIVTGHIARAKSAGRFGRGGSLFLSFDQIRLPDGFTAKIAATITAIEEATEGGKPKIKEEGQIQAPGSKKRAAIEAGGGAAIGGAIGGATGGGSGAGVGIAIGAAAGAADVYIRRKGKEVVLPAGTIISIELKQPLTIVMR